ncbi:DoxX family protein [uncultured Sulfitobacter sp.]|uniref:DoxX family protein n=1 Tax=uncultured Sulfitobacter sp. TaxID=191468 RepID=UPI002619775A|nr:DoxX family protein [uncultured Sulfitobacter sp.]
MNTLISAYSAIASRLERADWLLPTLARLVFAGVLLFYFLNSGMTKLGDGIAGIWTPSVGAYAQIFPKAIEAAGYDTEALSLFHTLVVLGGTWAEFILPVLIVIGLFTRIAALGMIGFVVVQSLTDVYGHGATDAIGAWFDRFADAAILDQRAFWVLMFLILVFKGAGPLSVDRALKPATSQ